MPYAAVNDVLLYYEEHGEGDPLVLLHAGLGIVGADVLGWARLLPAFAMRYRTIQVDLRGHGRSGNPTGRLSGAQLAADVAEFIELLDLTPVHVAGVSMGGCAALTLGMTRPDLLRSLVTVGAFYATDESVRAAAQGLDAARRKRRGR
jgi:pimeloyl-ACP methyl ester carboxylesterase